LAYRLSELRIIELLENLSTDLDSFKQVEVEGAVKWQHQDRVTGNVITAPDLEKQHWKRHLKRCRLFLYPPFDAILPHTGLTPKM